MSDATVHNNLKALRKASSLTLRGLGEAAGTSASYLHQLEGGKGNASLEIAYRIACVFGVSVYEIWPDTTEIVEETVTVRRVAFIQESTPMSHLMQQIQRESRTKDRIRYLPVVDIVEEIHGYEDRIEELKASNKALHQHSAMLESRCNFWDDPLNTKESE